MKTAEQILYEWFGIREDAPGLTPMDKGECIKSMHEYGRQCIDQCAAIHANAYQDAGLTNTGKKINDEILKLKESI